MPGPLRKSARSPRWPPRRRWPLPTRIRTLLSNLLTRTPGNSSSSPRRKAEWARRAAETRQGPRSASALGLQRPRPGRPSRGRAILVSRGPTHRSPSLPSCPPSSLFPLPSSLLPPSSPGASRRIPISAAAAADTRTGGAVRAQGLGGGAGLRETRAARVRARTGRTLAALRPGRERSRACGGSARRVRETGAPLPGRRACCRPGGAGLPSVGASPPRGSAGPTSPSTPSAAVEQTLCA